jgi:hypothetical protein
MFLLNFNTEKEIENTILISEIRKNVSFSAVFRNYIISIGYSKLPVSDIKIKGELCYDGYYRDYKDNDGDIIYTIYCYCYDFRGIIDQYEKMQFIFESQLQTMCGIIGMETIQWVSDDIEKSIINLKFFENSTQKTSEALGKIKFKIKK